MSLVSFLFTCIALLQLDNASCLYYNQALELVPPLIRRETPLYDFLIIENGDAAAAALRLVRYWKARREWFGERWLLPLDQTGHGALTMPDITMLRTGFMVTLPLQDGGVVTLYDLAKCANVPYGNPDLATIKAICMRCVFYVAYVYGCHRMKNITMVNVISGAPRPGIETSPKLWQDLNTALPLRFTKILVAQAFNPNKQHLIDFMAYQEQKATEFKSKRQLARIEAPSLDLTLRQLQGHGLEAQCLPRCLGGQYDYQQFDSWIRSRISVEDIMSSAPIRYAPCKVSQVSQLTAVPKRGALKRACEIMTQTKYKGQATKQQTTKERNALYSRRSFNKRKLERLALENERDLWMAKNDQVKRQNEDLQRALNQAKRLVNNWKKNHSAN